MRTSRRRFVILFWVSIWTSLGMSGLLPVSRAVAQDDPKINFQWAFGAIKNTDNGQKFESVTRDAVLKSGDQIMKSYAERPVTIIGNMRGSGNREVAGNYDVADFAVEISADSFFSKTYTVDH